MDAIATIGRRGLSCTALCGLALALAACSSPAVATHAATVSAAPRSGVAQSSPSPTADVTAAGVAHTSGPGHMSFRYPPSWTLAECDPGVTYSWGADQQQDVTIFLGPGSPNDQPPTECPVEDESPQVTLQAHAGPGPDAGFLPSCGASTITSSTVSVAAATATRVLTTYSGPWQCIGLPAVRDVVYKVSMPGWKYTFTYTYRQGDPQDLTAQFDRMIQQTMSFPPG